MKWVNFEEAYKGKDFELCYFCDVDGREVDFVLTENRKPSMFIECKYSDVEIREGF